MPEKWASPVATATSAADEPVWALAGTFGAFPSPRKHRGDGWVDNRYEDYADERSVLHTDDRIEKKTD
jgi:hypothetical protein